MTTSALDEGWKSSAPHAALLSKFRSPRDPGYFDKDYGMPSLREPAPTAVERFIQQGYPRPSPVEEKLEALRVPELKAALKRCQLKVSGRKSELIERLVREAASEVTVQAPA